MHFLWDGIRQAITLIVHGDPNIRTIVRITLQMAIGATFFALAIGLPIGLALGIGGFRGRGVFMALANAGLGLPPVVAGLILFLLLLHGSPLGFLRWIYTIKGMILAQTVLALPLVVTFTATAAQGIDPALLHQARAFGAARLRLGAFACREIRVAVVAAAIAAMGSALSEVGAVIIVGGNIQGHTETLAGAVLTGVSSGDYSSAIAVGMILLGLILVLGAAFTVLQVRVPRDERVRTLPMRSS